MTIHEEISQHAAFQTKGPTVLWTCVVLTSIATLFVAARLYVRGKMISRISLDDWLIILSMLCGYATLGLTISAVRAGNGRHLAVLSDEQKSGAIFYTMAGFCPGVLSFGIPKLAVVALLTRIMNPSRRHEIFLWVMTGICLLMLCGCVIILFAQCTPIRSQWDLSIKGSCWSPLILIRYAIVAGTISAIVDFYLAIYPATVLYKLRISLKKKIILSFALGLGSVAGVVAIYKSTRLPALGSKDFSYDAADITVWTSIEGNAIIIAACIPTLQPLFDRYFAGSFFSSTGDGNQYIDPRSHQTRRVELATIGSKSRNTFKQHRKMGVSDTTIGRDSQESILSSDNRAIDAGSTSGEQNKEPGQHDGIMRTQHLTIVYTESQGIDPLAANRTSVRF